ncbi:MAG: hypothetical protein ACRCSU_09655 [Paracoccaceae bacterium]
MNKRDDEKTKVTGRDLWLVVAVLLGIGNFFFILLLWNISGKWPSVESLSVSLTVLQTFIGIVALAGFWMIRGSAQAAASAEARRIAEKAALREIRDIVPPMAHRAALDYLAMREGNGATSTSGDGIVDMMQALDDEGGSAK